MTDPHVHFRDWNQCSKETVLHGMLTGAQAGFDVFFDMPNTDPAVTSREAVIRRLELGASAERELASRGLEAHYHLYCGVTADKEQIREMAGVWKEFFPRVCGLKMFASQSTGNMGITGMDDQFAVYSTLSGLDYRGVLAVHCEKEELFDLSAESHWERRPASSEMCSVHEQISFAERAGFKGTLHIAHISTAGALDEVKAARERGLVRVTCGATPHHALLNCGSETAVVRMNPPLRVEADRLAVWNALFDGTVDWIESDHAPHTLEDKKKGACGLPGFEGMLRLVAALRKAGMPEARLNALLCTDALKAFGIKESSSPVPEVIEKMLEAARRAYPFTAWN
ncbi:MAG: dihydroorotase [Spirochaetales bacterium]|nr:dihydroorotase [Spirochaetales bacterium]